MWVCNCKSKKFTSWHPTNTINELCIDCGHYALKSNERTRHNKSSKSNFYNEKKDKFKEFYLKNKEINKLYNLGLTMSEIAIRLDLHIGTVSQIKNLSGTYKKYREQLSIINKEKKKD